MEESYTLYRRQRRFQPRCTSVIRRPPCTPIHKPRDATSLHSSQHTTFPKLTYPLTKQNTLSEPEGTPRNPKTLPPPKQQLFFLLRLHLRWHRIRLPARFRSRGLQTNLPRLELCSLRESLRRRSREHEDQTGFADHETELNANVSDSCGPCSSAGDEGGYEVVFRSVLDGLARWRVFESVLQIGS